MKENINIKSRIKDQPSHAAIVVTVGETVSICRCWQSDTFPYCDGSHASDESKCCGPLDVIVQERES